MDELDRHLLAVSQGEPLDEAGLEFLVREVGEDRISEKVFGIGPEGLAEAVRARLDFLSRTAGLCPECEIEATGLVVRARMRLRELWRFYAPLCLLFLDFMRNSAPRRMLCGIAGPPGGGKTVLAGLLAALVSRYLEPEGLRAVAFSLDAFHLPNAELERIEVDTPDGPRPLRREKGSPRTFDVPAFVAALRRLRRDGEVSLPVYDRRIHDPVPDALRVEARDRIVFVEGNYLLLDRGPWVDVGPLLDLRCMLEVPMPVLRGGLIHRHVRGGRTPAEAKEHFEEVDVPSYNTIVATMARADLVLKRDARQRLVDVSWTRGEAAAAPERDGELMSKGEME